jgi:hypothetical protein
MISCCLVMKRKISMMNQMERDLHHIFYRCDPAIHFLFCPASESCPFSLFRDRNCYIHTLNAFNRRR